MREDGSIRDIVILGGGSSGWMSAAYLARTLGSAVNITLVESGSIGILGVGEASVPSIGLEFFEYLGLTEEQWMPECNGAFKIGIKYVDWAHPPGSRPDNFFYHVFGEARLSDGIPLTHYWIGKRLEDERFPPLSYACYPSAAICDAELSPKFLDGRAAVPYAYHFDAAQLGGFLRRWAVERGVARVEDTVVDVRLREDGDIDALLTQGGREVRGDLFIDCSGFRARLLGEALGEPFLSYGKNLLCDRAVALQVPYGAGERNTFPYTTAQALSSGWTWRIPLADRFGWGYVYSSAFLSAENAERELRASIGARAAALPASHIRMRVGRARRQWVGNCVAIGLAGGFIEPLESTGIYTVYAALYQLLRYFPRRRIEPVLREKFNERVAFMVDDIRDFIVLHYCTTSRTDTPFWRANREDLEVPESLRQDIELFKAGVPIKVPYSGSDHYNRLIFDAGFDRFWTNSNYAAILTGMGVLPERQPSLLAYRSNGMRGAEQHLRAVEKETSTLLRSLPPHHEYIERLQGRPISAAR
jgi:tryptophan 7-halogenase